MKLGKSTIVKKAVLRIGVLATALATVAATPVFVHAESLYQEGAYRPLTADNKAFRIGDVVTVQVLENSSASTNADTTTRRKNGITADFSLTRNPNVTAGVNVAGDFDGGGRTQRASKLLAQLTVTVTAIQPNGDLQLAGEQVLFVNDEEQRVKLQGRARPQDISDGNIIVSTRLADAKITYVGEGDLSDRQRRSWWRSFMDWIGF